MKALKFLLIFLIIGFCSCGQKSAKHKPDPEAVKLNNKIVPLVPFIDNIDSSKKALVFLDSATSIDSNYFLGYYNKLMFLYALKEYNKAVLAINNCIRIRPNAHDLFLTGGILYEKIRDTISSKSYFEKSLKICNSVLDTMKANNTNYIFLSTNKAVNLIMLGDAATANRTLKHLYDTLPDAGEFAAEEKKYILSFINKNKTDLIKKILLDPDKDIN